MSGSFHIHHPVPVSACLCLPLGLPLGRAHPLERARHQEAGAGHAAGPGGAVDALQGALFHGDVDAHGLAGQFHGHGHGDAAGKPVDLMRWLVRLVTPPGGLVLDPFSGTGTTGEAVFREGFRAVLIEREPAYCGDIRRRMSLCLAGRSERRRVGAAVKAARKPLDLGPLFSPPEAAE